MGQEELCSLVPSLDLVYFPITGAIASALLISPWPLSAPETSLGGVHSSVLILRVSVMPKPLSLMHFRGEAAKCLSHSVTIAAVTNSNELSGSKQHTCVIFQFWRSEVSQKSHWAKIKVWQSCLPSGGAREESVSWLFPAFRCHPHSLVHGPHLPSSEPARSG